MEALFGQRLSQARKMAGLSLQALADLLAETISRQALHKYEQGAAFPNSKTLIALAKALHVSVDFFFTEPTIHVQLAGVEFRKRTALRKHEEEAIIERCTNDLERYIELETTVNHIKTPTSFSYREVVQTSADAEKAAETLRKDWGLGNAPVPGVLAMLEDNGYKVVLVDAPETFDGLKATFGDHRLIAVNKNFNICRIRFTALHELAHHILVFPEDILEKDMEKLCHAFAGAVLFPAEKVREAMHESRFHFYLPEMTLLKAYWGISIAAMFARAKNLGIISEYNFIRLNQGYRTRGYHKDEPGKFDGRETIHRFDQLLYRGLAEEILTINQAAILSNKTVGELRTSLDALI